MAKKLTLFNHAGGAMKTSLARDVGYTLASQGLRVLLIDLDPQANLTSWLGLNDVEPEDTLMNLAMGETDELPTPLKAYGMDIIPAHVSLALVEGHILMQMRGTERLAEALKAHDDEYDVVFVDSSPSLGQLAVTAALAADMMLVPIPTRKKGLDAMPGLITSMKRYRQVKPDLKVGAYIPTLYDARRSHDREVLALLQQQLSPLTSPVPQREAVWLDSNSAGQPVGIYAPNSPVHKDILKVTKEIAQFIGLGVEVK